MKHKITERISGTIAAILSAAVCVSAMVLNCAASTTAASFNSRPVAMNLSLETYREVAVTGTFSAMDPEGDDVTYTLASEPKKGAVSVDGDSFTYTPTDGKKGKDTFTYIAIDSAGNESNEATVTVKIKKQSTDVSYSDMEGSGVWYEATELAERGIFVGENVGGYYVFSPDTEVTRGEFLAMCVRLSGNDPIENITRTGFYDDADIPDWQKPYVSAAVLLDIVSGRRDGDGKLVFAPNDAITFSEATVMLNNALSLTDVSSLDGTGFPAWASQAVSNLVSVNIISSASDASTAVAVTRADAARMLVNAMNVVDARET